LLKTTSIEGIVKCKKKKTLINKCLQTKNGFIKN